MLEIIGGILLLGTNIIFMIFMFIIMVAFFAIVSRMVALKGRNVWIWTIAAAVSPLITVIVLFFVTRKYPKMESEFSEIEELKHMNPMVVSVVGLAGYIASSDGTIDSKEYEFIYNYLKSSYAIAKKDLKSNKEIIAYTKEHPEMMHEYIAVINKYTKPSKKMMNNLQLTKLLFTLVTINNKVEESEIKSFKEVMIALDIEKSELDARVESLIREGINQETINAVMNTL